MVSHQTGFCFATPLHLSSAPRKAALISVSSFTSSVTTIPHCHRAHLIKRPYSVPRRFASETQCTAAPTPQSSGLDGTGPLYLILIAAQLIPFVFPNSGLPGDVAYFSITAVTVLFLGCRRAQLDAERTPVALLSSKMAVGAPFAASFMLFGAYLLLRYTSIDVNLLLSGLTSFSACICLKESLDPITELLCEKLGLQEIGARVPTTAVSASEVPPTAVSDWVAAATSILVTAGYLSTKSFVLSNMLALGIAARVLSLIQIESFGVAVTLLMGLLLYDAWWVFGSEAVAGDNVMVAVATLDSPGKLLFPRQVIDGVQAGANEFKYAVLGLGDIFVPGLFLRVTAALSDVTKGPYFNAGISAYGIGLLTCFGANTVTRAPQPALIYIVPALLLSSLTTAGVRGELQTLLKFRVNAKPAAELNEAELNEAELNEAELNEAEE